MELRFWVGQETMKVVLPNVVEGQSMKRTVLLSLAVISWVQLDDPLCTMENSSFYSRDKVAESHHQEGGPSHSETPSCPTFVGCSMGVIAIIPFVASAELPPTLPAVRQPHAKGLSAPVVDIKNPPPRALI